MQSTQSIEEYVAKIIDNAPPLSPEQADKIAFLLRGPATPAPLKTPEKLVEHDDFAVLGEVLDA